ncbi:heavy metal translocating P-type ATPase [Helicobacter anatolicus]|uniref:heavy metal translocating P-type ATPase n=1 Tax=Helicobacter anatolicus TaxID=2905874 RepID=UPI001E5B5A72|nr:heavy metal translocating P-type ATPase [Helicobacter anatolicus]MCE3038017.1 cadmium-translocating P-type ATPase [Helicobacter anatolicus]
MQACSHCNLKYPKSSLKEIKHNDKILYFCCNGCEGVYFLLLENHLESFYEKRNHHTLTPPKDLQITDLSHFDSKAFEKYLFEDSKGLKQVALTLEGIHCVACTWLIEKALQKLDGIYDTSLNYTNNKLKIVFDLQKIPLSQIIKTIRMLGYDANIYDPKTSENKHQKQSQKYYFALIIAIFCTMNIMWIAVAQYAGYFSDISTSMKNVLNLASFLLATPVLFWTGRFFYIQAYYQLKNKIIGMDLLVSTGAFLTYFYSIYASLTQSGETYFEAVSMIITFVFFGKFLEIRAKKHAGDNLDKLSQILPTQLTIIKNNQKQTLSPQEVEIGSIIEVSPNEIIAIDGILLSSEALLDTQNISGEMLPKLIKKDDILTSGSINTQKTIRYQSTKTYNDSTLFQLINILENSLSNKPQIQNLANALSEHFSRFVLLIALLSFCGWYFIGERDFEFALMIAISVIVISCPCALALATPIASIVGISEAFKHKIIFKETKFLESIARANCIFFDKTGTLTLGKPQVIQVKKFCDFDENLLACLLDSSHHPIAKSIKNYLNITKSLELQDSQEILGKGIIAKKDGKKLIGGSLKFLQENGIKITNFDPKNFITFGFGIDKKICAIFLLEDALKQDAKNFIQQIKTLIPQVVLLSGDHQKSVEFVAKNLGIKEYYHSLLPQDKLQILQKNKEKISIMVGDGINDTLALKQSNIGISFSTKNDIISLNSDIILLDQNLKNLENTLKISHKTYKTIKQNIFLSIFYNLLMIPLAICGWIIPLFAALSMSFSSLLVITNSLRIKNWKKDSKNLS